MAGVLIGLYLVLFSLSSIPFVQNWLGNVASTLLSQKVNSRVQVESVRMGLLNRIILDGVTIHDQQDSLLLQASRIAAKIEILPLVERKIRINNAQLFSADAHLYQQTDDGPLNCKYIIDAFASKDTTHRNTIDLKIGRLLVRHCNVSFHQWQYPNTPDKFNIHHTSVTNFNLTASLKTLTPDSIHAIVKRMDFSEASGIQLEKLQFILEGNRQGGHLSDFTVALPHSTLSIPTLSAKYPNLPQKGKAKEWLELLILQGELHAEVCPSDLQALLPGLHHFDNHISIHTKLQAENGTIMAREFKIYDDRNLISCKADANITDLAEKPAISCDIDELTALPEFQQFITRNLQGEAREISPFITRLGTVTAEGQLTFKEQLLTAQANISTKLGNTHIAGILDQKNKFDADIDIIDFELGKLLKDNEIHDLGKLSLQGKASGLIKGDDGKPDLNFKGIINEFIYKNYPHRNVLVQGTAQGSAYQGSIALDSENASVNLQGNFTTNDNMKSVQCRGRIEHFKPYQMNLTKKYEGEEYSAIIEGEVDIQNNNICIGEVQLDSFTVHSAEKGDLSLDHLSISSQPDENGQHLSVKSPILELKADGDFRWRNVHHAFMQIANSYLPSIFPHPSTNDKLSEEIAFSLHVQDTAFVERLSGQSIRIPERAYIEGQMNSSMNLLTLNANVPSLQLGNEELKHVNWRVESTSLNLQSSLMLQRLMKNTPVDIGLDANTGQDILSARFHWTNHQGKTQKGELDLTGEFYKDLDGKQAIHALLNESEIIISDTAWTVKPAKINYHDGVVDVHNVLFSQGDRYMRINGRVSKEETDTLTANLHRVNVAYLFSLANFNAMDLGGEATGKVYGRSLMQKPQADAYIRIDNFTLNGGAMGYADAYANWGKRENSLTLQATMLDPAKGHRSTLDGYLCLAVPKAERHLDLNVKAHRVNCYFLNKYTDAIFTNFQGRANGWVHVFGNFGAVDLEGEVVAEEASMHVNVLGVDYQAMPGDSVILTPGHIYLKNLRAYDNLGGPEVTDHRGVINGEITFEHFKNMRYAFDIKADNILGYDFREFGDNRFYGTVYATGTIHLTGKPGEINVDLKGSPTAGTQFVVNASTPETLTEAGFITYVSHKEENDTIPEVREEESTTDMHLNFDLDITPDCNLRILMDPASGDYISLNGNGRILANYYNKDKFRMYGTYHVDHGIYKLSIQEVIHKDFQIQPEGTIVFGGDPYQAALNLKASYIVPNVSLDDLSATGLGLSNTRVDCVMNIGGKPMAPEVTFDFDLPNANEDEKQMVRSMVSTEEEKNMQVIYLLGIGRFYSYGNQYMNGNSQGGTAMNSLLSSTISSQFNQMLSNVMGTNNWSFGANLRTGETGWDQLDVEGILSGRLLDNRLLINGNFGYRESYYSTNNFIGDFDVQYLLTPGGGVSLKAYNQTNDRYFIQSSLTTQGLGIQFKKDFNRWREMLQIVKRKKKGKNEKKTSK